MKRMPASRQCLGTKKKKAFRISATGNDLSINLRERDDGENAGAYIT